LAGSRRTRTHWRAGGRRKAALKNTLARRRQAEGGAQKRIDAPPANKAGRKRNRRAGRMTYSTKSFGELTGSEVYEILKARMRVFLMEQHIVCMDTDDVDQRSLHLFFEDDGGVIIAYLRMFPDPVAKGTVRIGRVLTVERGKGLGLELMRRAMKEAFEKGAGGDGIPADRIYVEAQVQAIGFYEKLGFRVCTEEFLDEGVPHKGMELFRED